MIRKLVFYALQTIFWSIILIISLNFQTPWEVPPKYKNMKNPYKGKPDPDGIGKELWTTHCKSCHGKTGIGDGTKADELETELKDLTGEEVQSQTDGELYYKSVFGRDEMANYEKKIPYEEDRWLLINHIRTLKE